MFTTRLKSHYNASGLVDRYIKKDQIKGEFNND